MSAEELDCDLLVIGAGMAGLSAAGRASEAGAKVVVIEKGQEIGGSAMLSGGKLWTVPSRKHLAQCDDGDPELGGVVVDGYPGIMEWMRRREMVQSPMVGVLHGKGYQVDIVGHLRDCESTVIAAGGHVAKETMVSRLLTGKSGEVVGADTSHPDGNVRINAPWTLLATGGYQGSPELRARYIGPRARNILLRSNTHSCGDGLRLAEEVGGTYAGANPGFYGHLVCYPTRFDEPSKFRTLALTHSEHALLVDRNGRRYCDETRGDHLNCQETAFLPDTRALLFWDQRVQEEHVLRPLVVGGDAYDSLSIALAEGAQGALCQTMQEIVSAANSWGFDGQSVIRTVDEFNNLMRTAPEAIHPMRTGATIPLDKPPYRALVVQPAITFSHGGIRTDALARALDSLGRPIPGLLVAGADVGNVYRRGYAGGLALAMTFAFRALRTAALVAETS